MDTERALVSQGDENGGGNNGSKLHCQSLTFAFCVFIHSSCFYLSMSQCPTCSSFSYWANEFLLNLNALKIWGCNNPRNILQILKFCFI